MRRLSLVLAGIAIALPLQAQIVEVLESPVKVTAERRVSPAGRAADIRVTLQYQGQRFQLDVKQRANTWEDAGSKPRLAGWKDGFLFVRDDCQVADEAIRPWRCVIDHVYSLVEAKDGMRLAHLGDVFAGEDCVDEPKIGCSLYQGVFTDIYDRLENHSLAGRADAPALLTEMRMKSGELVVDLDETWGRNQERFSAGERCLAASNTERASQCTEGISPRRAYLFNAALATYTKRDHQLTRIRNNARQALCDQQTEDACSEILRASALMLAAIRPGEKARARNLAPGAGAPIAK
jgi:hypothetical protein